MQITGDFKGCWVDTTEEPTRTTRADTRRRKEGLVGDLDIFKKDQVKSNENDFEMTS